MQNSHKTCSAALETNDSGWNSCCAWSVYVLTGMLATVLGASKTTATLHFITKMI